MNNYFINNHINIRLVGGNMRIIGRHKRKKQKKAIILSTLSLLLLLTVGYAAFSTSLSITAKGNIQPRKNLYVSANGSDETGNGTVNKPYKTVQKAYDSAWENSTIYIMDNITVDETIEFNQEKNITLTSENNEKNSLLRGETDQLILQVTNGELTTENITLDGQNKNAKQTLLRVYQATVNLNSGTTIQNNIDSEDHGGGCNFNNSTVNIDGAKIINNAAAQGGGAFLSRLSNITINDGEFIGNTCGSVGGAIFFADKGYKLTINNGLFQDNSAGTSGGAITIASATLEINNVEISNNEAKTYNGGGIYIYALLSNSDNGYSEFTMNNGTITDNKAAKNGGGIYVTAGHTYKYVGGSITNNTPDNVYKN